MANTIGVNIAGLQEDRRKFEKKLDACRSITKRLKKGLDAMDRGLDESRLKNVRAKMDSVMELQITYEHYCEWAIRVIDEAIEKHESVDSLLKKYAEDMYDDKGNLVNPHPTAADASTSQKEEKHPDVPANVDYYLSNVSDAEYALLCKLSYDAFADNSQPTAEAFKALLEKHLPENDPLKYIPAEQIVAVSDPLTGFSAITVTDGDNALVIFTGTNGDAADILTDAELFLPGGASTTQSPEAIYLVNELSKTHSNIVVTGHSLGGYLATAATLKNDSVSHCVTFDAPGRYDTLWQQMTNGEQVDKIKHYEAQGSLISSVGYDVGETDRIKVEESGGCLSHNHSIYNLYAALNEKDPMANRWK